MTKNRKTILVLAIAACVLLNLVPVIAPLTPDQPTNIPIGPTPIQHLSLGARVKCREYVLDELRVPLSAKFIEVRDYAIKNKAANYTAILGTVQAQNAFGVVLESQYRCDMHYLPDKPEVWVLDKFRLEGE